MEETILTATCLKGYQTQTYTEFGRHASVFLRLGNELKKTKPDTLSCLVVGPGIDENSPSNFTRTYQPYELANCIERAKIKDYKINVIDINPKILSEMKKSPVVFRISQVQKYDTVLLDKDKKRHFNTFFTDYAIRKGCTELIVRVPEPITKKIKTSLCDIITEDIPESKYDVVICTAVLTHYDPDVTHEMKPNPVPGVINKLANSLKTKGYLIISEGHPEGFERLTYSSEHTGSLHTTSASLFQRIK